MRHSKFVTAKELASTLEMDERHIRRHSTQRRLGIDSCRDQTSCRVRFRRTELRQTLRARGIEIEE